MKTEIERPGAGAGFGVTSSSIAAHTGSAMNSSHSDLLTAFPAALRDDASASIAALPDAPPSSHTFSVVIGCEPVTIPYRIYHDPASIDGEGLTRTQEVLLACLLTRHYSGFVREENLMRILDSNHECVPPFVVQLVGEYVVEIIDVILGNIHRLDADVYRAFLIRNPAFYQVTKDRVTSYWNCYYRDQQKEDYAGFNVLEVFDRFVGGSAAPNV
jgi:hypothetical protein